MTVPPRVQISFAHATLQHLAEQSGADLLHIKGLAIDPSITNKGREGTDADVLVRPAHVAALLATLREHSWTVHTDFGSGSPFGHAMTLVHLHWGFADVHRLFPGITSPPEEAFERLWRNRADALIAGMICPVPSVTAQRTILVLNAARGGHHAATDLATAWEGTSSDEREKVMALVTDLGAQVAFAAAVGDLDRYRGAKEYDLWRVITRGGSRTEEWLARIKAAPNRREAVRLTLVAPLVNTDHLAVVLGHPPSRSDVTREFLSRARRGVVEAAHAMGRRLGGRGHR